MKGHGFIMNKIFGKNLKTLREARGMTQGELSEKIGITVTSISLWETQGKSPRSKQTVRNLCEALDCSERDLYGYADGFYAKRTGLADEEACELTVEVPVAASEEVPVLELTHTEETEGEDTCALTVEVPSSVVRAHPGCFLVHAEGGCMDNRYPEDSHLLIDPNMEPRQNCAVLAETSDMQSVVRVYFEGNSTLMLCADSHSGEYPDIVVQHDDPPITIKGVVVWYQADSDLSQ